MATKNQSSAEAMQMLLEISNILGTGLTEEQLTICARLIASGINPNALANVMRTLLRESAAINHQTSS